MILDRLFSARRASVFSVSQLSLLFAVAIASAGIATAQTTLQGRVYAGEVGDESVALAGVTVSLWGANNPYPDMGGFITSTTTDATGWYQLQVETGWEFYHIIETNPEGIESVGATSVDGIVRTSDWIEYPIPLEGKTLTGNKFWDQGTGTGEFTFEGSVYEGEVGDESRPLPGVEVTIRGGNNSYPDTGELIATSSTNGEGWYGLTVEDRWEFYHIIEVNSRGFESSRRSPRRR